MPVVVAVAVLSPAVAAPAPVVLVAAVQAVIPALQGRQIPAAVVAVELTAALLKRLAEQAVPVS